VEKPSSKVIRESDGARAVHWSPPAIDAHAGAAADDVQVSDLAPEDVRRTPGAALPTAAQLEQLHRKAYDDGYERGCTDGFRFGQQQGREAARAQIAESVGRIEELLTGLDQPFRALDDQVEREVVSLVVAIVRQLVRREVKTDPGQIVGVVREALSILPVASRNIQVLLHPEDAALVREVYALSAADLNWRIVEDPVIARGGCRVQTETSQVDATLESRLAALIAPLLAAGRSADAGGEGDAT
jgi:flagellar assembly protein FliH